jgi:glutamate/tyrosine decarboxylase-like PLP-dependent enzyme
VKEEGLQGGAHPRLVFYGSSETHNWARKAAELLGLGNRAFRRVPVDESHRVDQRALAAAITADREAGLHPFCVIGTAGTVNTGATDDLTAIADLCEREKLWFHVDGAFGALAWLSEELRPALAGMERADSLAFDLHKWGSMPFECACVLVRDAEAHRATFASSASYISPAARGVIAGGLPFAERSLELTRNFKALKVWMSLHANGADHHARIIEQNVHQARALAEMIDDHPSLELVAPVPLNVVCFRYVAHHLQGTALDALNEEILLRLQERGLAVPSGTRIDGVYAIRVAHVNHRSRRSDFEALVADVARLGDEILEEPS